MISRGGGIPYLRRLRPWLTTAVVALAVQDGATPTRGLAADAAGDRASASGPAAEPKLPGMWRPVRPARGSPVDEQSAELLEAIGYASGYERPPTRAGVVAADPDRAFDGLNFYTSGHAPEAFLIDMKGRELHRWRFEYRRAWPDDDPSTRIGSVDFWRRARLMENGDVLAIFEGLGLVAIDRDSKLLWGFPGGAHHDLDVAEDGRIYVLTRQEKRIPRIRKGHPILEEAITILSPKGRPIRRIPLLETFERSDYAATLKRIRPIPRGDVFHANSIEVLDGRHASRSAIFRKGNVLISLRAIDVIAVVDMEQEKVVWALSGLWHRQHEAMLVDGGNVLLFDNESGRDSSRVIEIDPFSQEIVWSYQGNEANGFYSKKIGSNQRLPNGNTLIVESFGGRAFEVAPDGQIVWEFVSPHRAGEARDLIAVLCDMVRIPSSFTKSWLGR